jgi:hypothetical protein
MTTRAGLILALGILLAVALSLLAVARLWRPWIWGHPPRRASKTSRTVPSPGRLGFRWFSWCYWWPWRGVLVLGGAHDLSASIKSRAPEAEYLRVATRGYREVSGGL